jgi:hypothetical protein
MDLQDEIYDEDSLVSVRYKVLGEVNGVHQNIFSLYEKMRYPSHGPLTTLSYTVIGPSYTSEAVKEYEAVVEALQSLADGWTDRKHFWGKEKPELKDKFNEMFSSRARRDGFAANYGLTDVQFDPKRFFVKISGSKESVTRAMRALKDVKQGKKISKGCAELKAIQSLCLFIESEGEASEGDDVGSKMPARMLGKWYAANPDHRQTLRLIWVGKQKPVKLSELSAVHSQYLKYTAGDATAGDGFLLSLAKPTEEDIQKAMAAAEETGEEEENDGDDDDDDDGGSMMSFGTESEYARDSDAGGSTASGAESEGEGAGMLDAIMLDALCTKCKGRGRVGIFRRTCTECNGAGHAQ